MSSKNYYKILGVGDNASADDIKRAYRKLAHQHHPDKPGGDETRFKEINEAYQVLSDADKRKQYDMLRRYGSAGFGSGFSPRGQAWPGGQQFGFDFGFGADSLEDIPSQFFGGLGYGSAGRGFGRSAGSSSRAGQTVQFSYQGPKGARIIIQAENVSEITPKMKKEVDEFVQKFFKEMK